MTSLYPWPVGGEGKGRTAGMFMGDPRTFLQTLRLVPTHSHKSGILEKHLNKKSNKTPQPFYCETSHIQQKSAFFQNVVRRDLPQSTHISPSHKPRNRTSTALRKPLSCPFSSTAFSFCLKCNHCL